MIKAVAGMFVFLVGTGTAELDDVLYVDGMAVDGLGLYRSHPLKAFSHLEHSKGALPEFTLAKPLFADRRFRPLEETAFFREFSQSMLETKVNTEDWFMAMEIIENRLAYKPGDLDSLRNAASLAAVMKDYAKAELYFRQYLKKRPRDLLMQAGRAHVLLYQGRFTDAEQVCEGILKVNPESLEARFTLLCLSIVRDLEPRAELVQERFWLFCSLPEKSMLAAWVSDDAAGLIRVMGQDGLQLLCQYTLGPGTHENLPLVHDALNQAELAYRGRQWGEALVFYHLAKEYGVSSVHMYQNMSRCYLEMGNAQEALDIMRILVQTVPEVSQVWANVGYILLQSGLYVEATKSFRQAVKLDPGNPTALFALAAAQAGAGQLDQAWPILERLAKSHPGRLPKWIDGNKPYLEAIQQDRRFPLLF